VLTSAVVLVLVLVLVLAIDEADDAASPVSVR
jgi:hypothetical protein